MRCRQSAALDVRFEDPTREDYIVTVMQTVDAIDLVAWIVMVAVAVEVVGGGWWVAGGGWWMVDGGWWWELRKWVTRECQWASTDVPAP